MEVPRRRGSSQRPLLRRAGPPPRETPGVTVSIGRVLKVLVKTRLNFALSPPSPPPNPHHSGERGGKVFRRRLSELWPPREESGSRGSDVDLNELVMTALEEAVPVEVLDAAPIP